MAESSFGHVEVAEGTSRRPEIAGQGLVEPNTVDAVYKSVQLWTLLVLSTQSKELMLLKDCVSVIHLSNTM